MGQVTGARWHKLTSGGSHSRKSVWLKIGWTGRVGRMRRLKVVQLLLLRPWVSSLVSSSIWVVVVVVVVTPGPDGR